MTTLVIPGPKQDGPVPLWRAVLTNIIAREGNEIEDKDLPKALPWLAPTLVSSKGRTLNEADKRAHQTQCFFGMPRRIELKLGAPGRCSMTGREGPSIETFIQRPHGVHYGLWRHPLTPYRKLKEAGEPFSVKPKSLEFGYSDWVATTINDRNSLLSEPGLNVIEARLRRRSLIRGDRGTDAILLAAGWVTENMAALNYLYARQPFHIAPDDDRQSRLDAEALRIAKAADEVAYCLLRLLRDALFGLQANATGDKWVFDKGVFNEARTQFYELTATAFHSHLAKLMDSETVDHVQLAQQWVGTLAKAAYLVFTEYAPAPIDSPEHARRIARAFDQLRGFMHGRGTGGKKIWEILGLPAVGDTSEGQGEVVNAS
jgi:CRISPR system Cascade subunit CasA